MLQEFRKSRMELVIKKKKLYDLIHSTGLCSNVSFTFACKLGNFFLFNKKQLLAFETVK